MPATARADALGRAHARPDPLREPGARVGPYELRAMLGSGGTATVFEARDVDSGEVVAVKLLHRELTALPSERAVFLDEARLMARIDHPGVARVREVGELPQGDAPPQAWFAMEVVRGVSLARLVRDHGPLDVDDALRLTDALLDALAAVHAAGVVHRDVTPANLMVEAQTGEPLRPEGVRLLDFGLAAAPGTTAAADSWADPVGLGSPSAADGRDAGSSPIESPLIWGSAPYLSPEHALGRPVPVAGDLYQVGAVLFFALTGSPPFQRETVDAVLRAHVNEPAPPPSTLRPDLPGRVDRVILRALQKSPGERYLTAPEMRWAVQGALLSLGEPEAVTAELPAVAAVSGPPTGALGAPAALVPPASGRRRGWALAIAGLVLVASASAAVALRGTEVAPEVTAASTDVAVPAATPTPTPAANATAAARWVTMPDIAGLSLGEARAALTRVGLTLGEVTTSHSSLPADTVLSAAQAPGVLVQEGTPVALTVASGSSAVPSVIGMTREEALAALAAAGFTGVPLLAIDAAGPDAVSGAGVWRVTSAAPAAGTIARLGAQVSVTLAPAPAASPAPEPEPAEPDPAAPVDPSVPEPTPAP